MPSHRRPRLVALALLATLVLSSCRGAASPATPAAETPDDATHTVSGSIQLFDGDAFPANEGGRCSGGASGGGFSDLATGQQVLIKDEAGTVLGLGEFGPGELDGRGGCVLPFEVADVPAAKYYEVLTKSSRPGRTLSAAELAADDWTIDLSLGDAAAAARAVRADCLPAKLFTTATDKFSVSTFKDDGYFERNWTRAQGTVTNTGDQDANVSLEWKVTFPKGPNWSKRYHGWLRPIRVGAGESATWSIDNKDPINQTLSDMNRSGATLELRVLKAGVAGMPGC